MYYDIEELVTTEFEKFGFNDDMNELIGMFIEDLLNHEKVSLDDITFVGNGKTSRCLKIGEYVLKCGLTRRTQTFKNSSRILQPVIRREIETESGDSMFIEVQNEVDTEWYKHEKRPADKMYEVYKDLRDDGLLWTDIHFKNVGKLLKDNRTNYTTCVHDLKGNIVEKEIIPDESATGLIGNKGKTLKKGDYVLLDTDFVFDIENLPDGMKIQDMLLGIYYDNFEKRYLKEKGYEKEVEK